jgi:hypothetical protein
MSREVAAAGAQQRLDRLSQLAKRAHAHGHHALYRRLMLAVKETLPLTGWRPPPLSSADQEAVRRCELFVNDVAGWTAQLVVLTDAGHLQNVTFGADEDSRRFVRDVRRLNQGWQLRQVAKVPQVACLRVKPSGRTVASRDSKSRRTRVRSGSRGDPPREDDDPDLDAPPRVLDGEAREWLRRQISDARQRELAANLDRFRLTCKRCGAKLTGRSHKQFCSPACKQAAWRAKATA